MTKITTSRPVAPRLEPLIGKKINVLDHGSVTVLDYMGTDAEIASSARMSYSGLDGKEKTKAEDGGLIRYLMRNGHTSPFEMCEIRLHVKLPVFVARQWIRHRTANVNEISARFSVLDNEFYIPDSINIAGKNSVNKQGRSEPICTEKAEEIREILRSDCVRSYHTYRNLADPIDEGGAGLANELARLNLPVNIYTQWVWKIDLHNLFHFLRLRSDAHAQYEIRAYADEIFRIVQMWVPQAANAFHDYRMASVTLSASEISEVRLHMENPGREIGASLQRSEKQDFLSKMQKLGMGLARK